MKIDIHTHTKRCKSGDAPTREITAQDFCEIVRETDVRIVAITNHNCFDLEQYQEIIEQMAGDVQIWPGIELDIVDGQQRGHLIILVSPKVVTRFSDVVKTLTRDSTPDSFTANIEKVLECFEQLSPVYIAHYKQKKPSLSDSAIEKLIIGTSSTGNVIREATNSISAGIYISHGHASIYGSDIQDWNQYREISKSLPELRLPVDSFEQFRLLLQKDTAAINTILDRKTPETLTLHPVDGCKSLEIKVFNDIHVIFGSKGTGKSCLLKAIAQYYSTHGLDARVYESGKEKLTEEFDLRGKDLKVNLNDFAINYCSDEITFLRTVKEADVTAFSKYLTHFSAQNTNRNAEKILLKDMQVEEEVRFKRDFDDYDSATKTTNNFISFLTSNNLINAELDEDEQLKLYELLTKLSHGLRSKRWSCFSDWKSVSLLNGAISTIRKEVSRKTGRPAKPTTTGFYNYALNRIKVKAKARNIVRSIGKPIPTKAISLGSLGEFKGELEFLTEFEFHDGSIRDASLNPLTETSKTIQKDFVNRLKEIEKNAFTDSLFHYTAELNQIKGVEKVATVYELLLFRRYFALNGLEYIPSSGEASMVMLQRELATEKDVYILDEPEKSLGNEYINDMIVPLIRERALSGKRIFISTHDANIAVRTLPYCSVYCVYDSDGYRTYIGNPFSNKLISSLDGNDSQDWRAVSMRTLEGGAEAFGERGKIYGHN